VAVVTSAGIADRARARWLAWLDRRIPPASSVTLDQRRIFIFPSQTGFFFFLCLLIMLIASINYQNNLGYALTFLLANLFVVAVLHTYANLAGLTVTAVGAEEAFAGQRTAFRLRLTSESRRGHYGLQVGWPVPREARRRQRFLVGLFSSPQMQAIEEVGLEPGGQAELRLHLPVGKRGWFSPGRLRIESVYPLGLLRCWTWVDLDLRALVYPQPLQAGEPQGETGEEEEGLQLGGSGDDEFSGIRDYREGDNPRRVHWKSLARGQALQSKEYAAVVSDTRWLDWAQFPGLANERRLSALCYWVLDYHRRELEYGLRLPGRDLAPGKGDRHRNEALRLLALYGMEEA
jgi:uncharacterized protein (DUF58 family)